MGASDMAPEFVSQGICVVVTGGCSSGAAHVGDRGVEGAGSYAAS